MCTLEDRHWYFVGKRQLALSLLKRYLAGNKPYILDGGCGTGRTLAELSKIYDAVGLEPFESALSYAAQHEGCKLIQGSLENIPFKNEVFDAVVTLDVLEHCDDDVHALGEISRILTPGGLLLITVPAHQWLWSRHDEALHHRRRYSKTALLTRLHKCGYVVEKISYFNAFVFPVVVALRCVGRLQNGDKNGSDTDKMPYPLLNRILYRFQCFERGIIGLCSLPFGVSLVCVARKVCS
jgi:SAM-dependent methyltransferase